MFKSPLILNLRFCVLKCVSRGTSVIPWCVKNGSKNLKIFLNHCLIQRKLLINDQFDSVDKVLDRVGKMTVLDFKSGVWESMIELTKSAYTMQRDNPENDQLYGYIKKIAQQDRNAFEQFYYAFSPRLANFLFKFLRQHDYVEEAVGDVMLVVWQNAARYRPSSKVSTWVFGIAYKKALKILARDRTSQNRYVSFEEEEMDLTIEDCERPDALAQHAELRHAIVVALDTLSVPHRAVIEMVFFEGFTYPEIAEILDCPVNTVKTRVHHAKKQLINHLNAHQ